ncbi:MAG: AraC family transcriptional regulator [Clostridiales bacterium]|nr:AraC family transcriptional regulator [Clostridiales bacterium]
MSTEEKDYQNSVQAFLEIDSAAQVSTDIYATYETINFPKMYPAYIVLHREHPAQPFPLHWHEAAELIYTRNQELSVAIDGKNHVVHPGEFILISSYALHAVIPSPHVEHQDVMSVAFQLQYLERMWPNIRDLVIDRDAPGASEQAVSDLKLLCEQLRTQMDMEYESNVRHFVTNQILFMMLQVIYSDFLVGERRTPVRENASAGTMVEVLAYLDENYRSNLTTQSVADRFGYSRGYFCHIFKKFSHQTFKQYLTELRLISAVEDLRSTNQSVEQVGLDSGFPDAKSFFSSFKKKYGVTPAQFRAQVKQANPDL